MPGKAKGHAKKAAKKTPPGKEVYVVENNGRFFLFKADHYKKLLADNEDILTHLETEGVKPFDSKEDLAKHVERAKLKVQGEQLV